MEYDSHVTSTEARRISLATGVLFLITFIASIPALYLFQPVLDDPPAYIAGGGDSNRIFLGAVLELVTSSPTSAPQSCSTRCEAAERDPRMGFVASRLLECTFMSIGVIAVLWIVYLQQDASAIDDGTFGAIAYTLAAIKDWTFLLGPGSSSASATG